jgi:hypothetical protein
MKSWAGAAATGAGAAAFLLEPVEVNPVRPMLIIWAAIAAAAFFDMAGKAASCELGAVSWEPWAVSKQPNFEPTEV